MEKQARESESLVNEIERRVCRIQSTAGHEKSCRKQVRPLTKAKYYLMTDSEAVPLGKVEKNPGRGVK